MTGASPAKALTGFRFVQIQQNDTLQVIAARALNDASKWADLVTINGLVYPYLTGDATQAGPTVLLYGQFIIVPSAAVQSAGGTDPTDIFGTDIQVYDAGDPVIVNGDLATVTGIANLSQALRDRIATELRELIFHLPYGCGVRATLGQGNGPTTGLLGAQYVKTACAMDPRIAAVGTASVTVAGDTTVVTATVQPIVGPPIDINMGL